MIVVFAVCFILIKVCDNGEGVRLVLRVGTA